MRKGIAALVAVALLIGCSPQESGIRLAGSTSVQPLAEILAEAFARGGGPRVTVQGGGSTAGVHAVRSGIADIGAVSRLLSSEETKQGLAAHIIAYDVLAVVVHPQNPVSGLTLAELGRVFRGEVDDWAQAGGFPGRIHLISREAGSGSREAFRTLVGPISPLAVVQGSSGAIRLAVMSDPRAIGYVSLGVAHMGGLKALAVGGQLPGRPAYRLARPLSFVTAGAPVGPAAAFIQFAHSPEGERLIRQEGLVPGHAGAEVRE